MKTICPWCRRSFEPKLNQIYCSKKCGNKYRKTYGHGVGYSSITFACSVCGRTVVTEPPKDKRSRFCSVECEKKYWKHPPHENPAQFTNFRSVREYMGYERRTGK